jgi:hypothetical protein
MKNRDAVGNPILNDMAKKTLEDFIEGVNFRVLQRGLRNLLLEYLFRKNQ